MILDADGRELAPRRDVWAAAREATRHRDELVAGAIHDARIQLDSERALARLFRARSTAADVAADKAEKRWREQNPGLAALVDYAGAG